MNLIGTYNGNAGFIPVTLKKYFRYTYNPAGKLSRKKKYI